VIFALKLVYLIGQLTRGGAEQQLYYLLSQRADPATVVVFSPGGYWVQPIRALGHTVIELERRSHTDLRRLLRLIAVLRAEKPDVVHLFLDGVSGLYGRIAVMIIGHRRFVVGERNIPTIYPRWFQRALPFLNQGVAAWIANSYAAAHDATARHLIDPRKIHVIANGLDIERITSAPIIAYPFPASWRGKTVIAQIGGLAARKNPLRFVRITALLRDTDARFVMIGDGHLRAAVEGAIRDQDLQDRVLLMGERNDVPSLLRHIDILALTSDHEGTPNVILEGMAAGIPAVVTDVGDAGVLVESGLHGFAVPPDDENAFAASLRFLLENAEARQSYGDAARDDVQRYAISAMAAVYDTLYKHLSSRRK